MCPHCEGRIPLNAEVCPYCQFEASIPSNPKNLEPPMAERRFTPATPLGIPTIPTQAPSEKVASESKSSFLPILLLSLGGNLMVIGLLQLLFSDEGFLRLEWKSHYWFAYCLGALPLLFLGLKRATLLKD
jgi:hypothetical protein